MPPMQALRRTGAGRIHWGLAWGDGVGTSPRLWGKRYSSAAPAYADPPAPPPPEKDSDPVQQSGPPARSSPSPPPSPPVAETDTFSVEVAGEWKPPEKPAPPALSPEEAYRIEQEQRWLKLQHIQQEQFKLHYNNQKAAGFDTPFRYITPNDLRDRPVEYPWLRSNEPARKAAPTFWTMLRDKHLLSVAIARARTHLRSPEYEVFEYQLEQDVLPVVHDMFVGLSDMDIATDARKLRPVMTLGIGERFAAGARTLRDRGQRVEYKFHSRPSLRLLGIHFTYGPYPAPADYVMQPWVNIITLVIPKEDAKFESTQKQRAIMKRAEDEGVFMRVNMRMTADIEMCLYDGNELPLMRDRRKKVDFQFVSPHFTPWDQPFDYQDGVWGPLRWQWRVSDIDYLLQSEGEKAKKEEAGA
ncbi:hypothetical protein HK104_010978 [Borealophlyctis nickersoniae]|nr:hypothetical protein HK104_010978 [Borealophlyctis nickersoniae]